MSPEGDRFGMNGNLSTCMVQSILLGWQHFLDMKKQTIAVFCRAIKRVAGFANQIGNIDRGHRVCRDNNQYVAGSHVSKGLASV